MIVMVRGTARSAPATLQIQPQKITDSRSTNDDTLSALSVSHSMATQHGHAKAQGCGRLHVEAAVLLPPNRGPS
jgi:hypothetical protein